MDYVLVFLCPGCGLRLSLVDMLVGLLVCPVCGDWLLCGLLVLALYVGFLYRADAFSLVF